MEMVGFGNGWSKNSVRASVLLARSSRRRRAVRSGNIAVFIIASLFTNIVEKVNQREYNGLLQCSNKNELSSQSRERKFFLRVVQLFLNSFRDFVIPKK